MIGALDHSIPADPASREDRCPHRRPFPARFAGCAAFQPVGFVAADALEQPIGEAVTCRHLGVGEDAGGRFYARCTLGGDAARVAWVTEVGAVRLDVVRSLEEEFAAFSAPLRATLVAARAAAHRTPWDERRRNELDTLVSDYLTRMSTFLGERAPRLEDAGIPLRPLLDLASRWWWAWARRHEMSEPVVADDPALEDDEALSWLDVPDTFTRQRRRGRAREGARTPPSPAVLPASFDACEETVLTDTERLRVARRRRPDDRLMVSGEVDAGTADVLVDTLTAVDGADDLHVDLGGILFLGLGGVRALVRVAAALPEGRTLVLHRPPPEARRVMQLIGWPKRVELGLDGTPVRRLRTLDIGSVRA